MTVVLGVDAGGTSSRAVAITAAGKVIGRGRAGGGNPMAIGPREAFANLGQAVRQALASTDPAQVEGVTVGLAGAGILRDPSSRAAFDGALRDCGLRAPARAVGDVVVAFAAGTAARSGTVLISGTGAIAAKIIDHQPTALADGYGWLLGDEGSAFWLGQAAARAAIRQASGRVAGGAREAGERAPDGMGPLTRLVLRHLLFPDEEPGGRARAAFPDEPGGRARAATPGRELADLLATAVQSRPPRALAELAPLVSRAAEAGDPAAGAIVAEAAARLAATVSEVREPGDRTPVVLAGSVLTSEGPVRRAVQDLLRSRDAPVAVAGDGAGAAAWLAAGRLLGPREAATLHRRFVAP
ncbi:N-acetylglucosamine kinase [Planobispora takensis]|uniref:N-acetylglucosamine kinase n=1 Tax=Planobispora takensis TaxID=1367882 RepID=A0A8J3SQA0_9ACTN|nr:BadF/BadG/BcrA/BcrD ATPase family protein [Planobispora takensis]GIH98332.1 N-acetylglucosamine kinase [Planobispora takensis]